MGPRPDMSITARCPARRDRRREGADVSPARRSTASEAQRLGWPPASTTTRWRRRASSAAEIASKSPDAIRGAKRLYDEVVNGDPPTHTLGARGRDPELDLIGSPNQLAAVTAGLRKAAGPVHGPGVARRGSGASSLSGPQLRPTTTTTRTRPPKALGRCSVPLPRSVITAVHRGGAPPVTPATGQAQARAGARPLERERWIVSTRR